MSSRNNKVMKAPILKFPEMALALIFQTSSEPPLTVKLRESVISHIQQRKVKARYQPTVPLHDVRLDASHGKHQGPIAIRNLPVATRALNHARVLAKIAVWKLL